MAPMNLPASSHGRHDGNVDSRINKHQRGVYYNDISFILSFTTVYRLVSNLMREWSDKEFVKDSKKNFSNNTESKPEFRFRAGSVHVGFVADKVALG
jgi:hypothetical protein